MFDFLGQVHLEEFETLKAFADTEAGTRVARMESIQGQISRYELLLGKLTALQQTKGVEATDDGTKASTTELSLQSSYTSAVDDDYSVAVDVKQIKTPIVPAIKRKLEHTEIRVLKVLDKLRFLKGLHAYLENYQSEGLLDKAYQSVKNKEGNPEYPEVQP